MATTEELLDRSFHEHHAEWIPTGAILVIEAMDPESGEPHLFHVRADEVPSWKAIGMLEVALGDMKYACAHAPDEDDD